MLLLCMMPLNISAVIVCRPLELQNLNEKLNTWNELGRMHPIKFRLKGFFITLKVEVQNCDHLHSSMCSHNFR